MNRPYQNKIESAKKNKIKEMKSIHHKKKAKTNFLRAKKMTK